MTSKTRPDFPMESAAVRQAMDFGVDVTLLVENLRLTPTARVRRAQQALESVLAVQAEARAWRERRARRS